MDNQYLFWENHLFFNAPIVDVYDYLIKQLQKCECLLYGTDPEAGMCMQCIRNSKDHGELCDCMGTGKQPSLVGIIFDACPALLLKNNPLYSEIARSRHASLHETKQCACKGNGYALTQLEPYGKIYKWMEKYVLEDKKTNGALLRILNVATDQWLDGEDHYSSLVRVVAILVKEKMLTKDFTFSEE